MGRGRPTAWPAEITFIFHPLRRHPKSILYGTEVDDIRDLQQRMQNGNEIFLTTPGIFQRVRQSLFRRAHPRLEAQGERCFLSGDLSAFQKAQVPVMFRACCVV